MAEKKKVCVGQGGGPGKPGLRLCLPMVSPTPVASVSALLMGCPESALIAVLPVSGFQFFPANCSILNNNSLRDLPHSLCVLIRELRDSKAMMSQRK